MSGAVDASNAVRPLYRDVDAWLQITPQSFLSQRRHDAEFVFRRTGITFAVYSEGGDPDRLIPFDIIPRLIGASEWELLHRGLAQRVRALNAFLADSYGPRDFIRAGHIPAELVLRNPEFVADMNDLAVPGSVYTHIAGIDIVRTGPSNFVVLEDNCRTPSGVAYMLENRDVMMRLFPELFTKHRVRPVAHYPEELLQTLRSAAPRNSQDDPVVVLLTPGPFNSAYYEHSFLADEMGIELVEGPDLIVDDGLVHMRTT
ncbi:MAG: circularly permuted type 2 ATP-grasp protein, partial [Proteobacteria bacterium]|nr:circularly permuted type 2 ATP-grasp protein [Pseudomonadota bacterium]